MSTVIVNELQADEFRPPIPLTELGYRVVKNYRASYTGGAWNPNTTYNWVPGMHFDYTPELSNSRIRVYCTIPYASVNAAHAISHWRFFANGVEQGRHCVSGNHLEDNSLYTWDFPSWGTSIGRIGYQLRSYTDDSNETRLYTTRYWDGVGSGQNCRGNFTIEEYLVGV